MNFKQFLLESIDHQAIILGAIERANNAGGGDGGNCGMYAYALQKWLAEREIYCSFAFICEDGYENVDDVMAGEPNIYHACIYYTNKLYDCTGKITADDLFAIAEDQYKDYDADDFILHPNKGEVFLKIMRNNTNWKIYWKEFYKAMEES